MFKMDTHLKELIQNALKNSTLDEFELLPGMGIHGVPAHCHMEVDLEVDLWLDQEKLVHGFP